ncbi:MAG: serine hydrolase domain-containing protein [Draconibacterium sp.]|nr:serine hydrolase domain-containing protein [Draconibacterium sp.]
MRYRNYLILLLAVLFLVQCNTKKEPQSKSAIFEEFLSECYSKGVLNGSVLVAENGKIIYQKAFGISGDNTNLSLDSQFRLASVSKQVTATTVMILKEEGKLSFDDPVTKYIPELPYDGITIRHLLNHTSGLPDYVTLCEKKWRPDLKPDNRNRTIHGIEEILKIIIENNPPKQFEPGEKYEYSNTGYVFLAIIVERISGMPFHKFMKENVFRKAGMKHTWLISPVREDPLKNRVRGYYMKDDKLILNDFHFLNSAQGDGEIFSTLGDLYKWDRALYTEDIISQKTLNEAYTPGLLNNGKSTEYGFGVNVSKSKSGKTMIAHGGGWLGFRTWIGREIEDNNCIIILTNNSTDKIGFLTEGLQNILHGKKYRKPS